MVTGIGTRPPYNPKVDNQLKRLRKWIRLDPLSYLYKNISKNHNIFQYLLLHLHIFEDGVYPPGLGKHGSESCCVSNNEDPRPNLSEQQWDMKLCHVINWWSRLETTSDLTAICIFLQKFIQSSIMKHSKNKVLSDLFPISEAGRTSWTMKLSHSWAHFNFNEKQNVDLLLPRHKWHRWCVFKASSATITEKTLIQPQRPCVHDFMFCIWLLYTVHIFFLPVYLCTSSLYLHTHMRKQQNVAQR